MKLIKFFQFFLSSAIKFFSWIYWSKQHTKATMSLVVSSFQHAKETSATLSLRGSQLNPSTDFSRSKNFPVLSSEPESLILFLMKGIKTWKAKHRSKNIACMHMIFYWPFPNILKMLSEHEKRRRKEILLKFLRLLFAVKNMHIKIRVNVWKKGFSPPFLVS